MAFKHTRGNKTVEAHVMPAPGGTFKGYIWVTIQRGSQTMSKLIGRDAGRPVATEAAAMELAEAAAQRELAR